MTIQLVGEIVGASFERGISQYPAINDEVHLVTDENLAKIYGDKSAGQIVIGRLAGAESIEVKINLDKLVTRHSAVLGSTGSGKSTTVTSLLSAIAGNGSDGPDFPSSRILLLDIHGEYGSALRDVATVFRVNPSNEQHPLHVPYWAIRVTELLQFLAGKVEEKALTSILDKIQDMKQDTANSGLFVGTNLNALTADSPLPFSLKKLWFDLIDPEIRTCHNNDGSGHAVLSDGDAENLVARKFEPHGAGSTPPHQNKHGVLSIKRQLSQMRSRLLDRQYDFMLHPGDWEPALDGSVARDLPDLLQEWLGPEKPITILDLSGVPSTVLIHLIGGILNIVYEALVWGRNIPEGGRQRPLLVVMEEAHRYLGKDSDGLARDMVQRIVKEGRKFGVGAMIVSQRPSEIDETILSQCGTFVSLRLSNSADRSKVQAALPDSLSGLIDSLPILRTGEAIITGEAAMLPIRCRISLPPETCRPSSEDPSVATAWSSPRNDTDYVRLSAAWRAQNPQFHELPAEEI
jgi:DNA helicase HerA-like ATPase